MSIRKRFTLSLLISVGLSILFLIVLLLTRSELIFLLQLPGYYASVSLWGVHSGPSNAALGALVFGWVNAIAYWPFVFACTFFFRRNPSRS
jgi:hypothetical protein